MARMSVGVLTYDEATSMLRAAERAGRTSVKVGHNTWLEFHNGAPSFRYHDTHIVTITPDDTYELNTGHFWTVTTKQRLNALSPANVYQRKYAWYVNGTPFFDSITVDSTGRVVNA